jgi:hypothetical protein
MSRARQQMHLVTDNKVALRSAVTRTSKRLSPWEVINNTDQERVLSPVIDQARQVDLQAGKKTKEKGRPPELSPLARTLAELAWESQRSTRASSLSHHNKAENRKGEWNNDR